MLIEMLKSKIHRARVTDSKLYYSGSLSIDAQLLKSAHIHPYEKIDVFNINNGQRFTTYAIPADNGIICVNGAAARLANCGDELIIVSYCILEQQELESHKPIILILDEHNHIMPAGE
jgi:aspartate 1-decarboxylase